MGASNFVKHLLHLTSCAPQRASGVWNEPGSRDDELMNVFVVVVVGSSEQESNLLNCHKLEPSRAYGKCRITASTAFRHALLATVDALELLFLPRSDRHLVPVYFEG